MMASLAPSRWIKSDRMGVAIYRTSLGIAAIALAIGTAIALSGSISHSTMPILDGCYWAFFLALGVGLWTIHIYLAPLHKALQILWLLGGLGSLWAIFHSSGSLIETLYNRSSLSRLKRMDFCGADRTFC